MPDPNKGTPAPASANTLRKLGADLRWLIEKSGIDPEKGIVTIGVTNNAAQLALINTFKREFDPKVMRLVAANIFMVHGVYVAITVVPAVANITRPPETA